MEQHNSNTKEQMINAFVNETGAQALKAQLDNEQYILDMYSNLMNEHSKNSKEFKLAKIEHSKQMKVFEYFSSDTFKDFYLNLYKEKMQVFDEDELQYLMMQQRIAKKVNEMSKTVSEIVCDIADNIIGESQLNA